MDYLSEVDYSLLVVNQLFPPELPPIKFDKGLDLIKTLTCTTVPGMIGQVFETGIKMFQTIQNSKYKAQTVEYVSNMYEVQKRSEIELRRLETQAEQNKTLRLYIDKAFQAKVDELSKTYHFNMRKLKNEHDAAVHKINSYAEIELKRIDKHYAAIIREQELKCVMYRQFLQQMYGSKVTPADLVAEASMRYFNIIDKSYDRQDGNSPSTQAAYNQLMEFIKFMGDPNRFVSFNDYIDRTSRLGG